MNEHSPEDAPSANTARYRPLRPLAMTAAGCIGSVAVVEVVALVAWWSPFSDGWWVLDSLFGLVGLAGSIAWLLWFHRAYGNLEALGHTPEHARWWAVVAWMIPILNLFRPYQMTAETWRGSLPRDVSGALMATAGVTPAWLGLWWAAYLARSFFGRLSGGAVHFGGHGVTVVVLATVVSVAAAALAVKVLLEITTLQERAYQASRGLVVPEPF